MDERTDQELVRAGLDGRQYAYEELVRRHQDAVFGLAVSMTRNREDAADMAQEAFIRAYNKLEQYNPAYSFRSWILRICANLTKNMFRSRTRRRNMEEQHMVQTEIEQSAVDPDFQELEEALVRLPPKLEAPLRLKYMEGLSYDEVAKVLGVGVSAAKMRVLRAKKLLVEYLKP
ncbi:MAG: RNA polymerase sigma factor [Verrucomicrobiota bacterium]